MPDTHSISFNGSSQYDNISNAIISLTSTWTIEFWTKLNAEISSGLYEWMHLENNTTKHVLYVRYDYNGGTRRLYVQKDRWVIVGATATYNVTLGTANWNHIAVTHYGSGGAFDIWLNGVIVGSCASSDNSNGNTTTSDMCRVGAAGGVSGTGSYANVKMDEIRIWNTARTSLQINDNMRQQLVGNESGLVAYWRMNDNHNDTTANALHLTPTNSPTFTTDVPLVDPTIITRVHKSINGGTIIRPRPFAPGIAR